MSESQGLLGCQTADVHQFELLTIAAFPVALKDSIPIWAGVATEVITSLASFSLQLYCCMTGALPACPGLPVVSNNAASSIWDLKRHIMQMLYPTV